MPLVVTCFYMRKPSFLAIAYRTTRRLRLDVLRLVSLGFRSRSQLAAQKLGELARRQLFGALAESCLALDGVLAGLATRSSPEG